MFRSILLAATLVILFPAPAAAQGSPEADVIETATLAVGGVENPIRALRVRGRLYLNLEDVADAVGGAWGRDPLSHNPLFTVGDTRVLFSTKDRRFSIDGRRHRLSRPIVMRSGGVWVPPDFVQEDLPALIDERVTFIETPPRGSDGRAPPPGVTPSTGTASSPVSSRDSVIERQAGPGRVHTVVLDPGHGGEENGAEGPTGLLEKDVVLQVARRLRIHLERRGYDVYLTRDRDVNLSLDERAAVANNRQADLFVSIHANASPGRRARGAETYYLSLDRAARSEHVAEPETAYLSGSGRDDPLKMILWDMAQSSWLAESQRLAEIVQAEFNRVLDIPDRGVKQAPFRVLVGATMPAVLVEVGFISNAEEEERLRDAAFLDRLVGALARSIDSYRAEHRPGGGGDEVSWPAGARDRKR
ncbi:MAG: N-acetylmuramoyl-L-alanine amidase [Acidobacteriota bacterium]